MSCLASPTPALVWDHPAAPQLRLDTVDEVVAALRGLGALPQDEHVKAILEAYHGTDWRDHLVHDPEKAYSRNLLALTPAFAMLVLTWNPGCGSPIHSHGGSHCTLKLVHGADTREEQFEIAGEKQIDLSSCKIGASIQGGTGYIDDGVGAHRLYNYDSDFAVTINVYYPPYDECVVFDADTGAGTVVRTDLLTQALAGQ